MTEVSTMRIGRKSSIEFEPRTLNFQQIESARDAALYVVNTRTMEEATQIFTEGMSPITSAERKTTSEVAEDEYFGGVQGDGYAFPSYSYNDQQSEHLREVLTAPF